MLLQKGYNIAIEPTANCTAKTGAGSTIHEQPGTAIVPMRVSHATALTFQERGITERGITERGTTATLEFSHRPINQQ